MILGEGGVVGVRGGGEGWIVCNEFKRSLQDAKLKL